MVIITYNIINEANKYLIINVKSIPIVLSLFYQTHLNPDQVTDRLHLAQFISPGLKDTRYISNVIHTCLLISQKTLCLNIQGV